MLTTNRNLARLAARAVGTCRLWARECSAPAPASCSITRHLRAPWTGGLVSLARAAGVDRIEPGCNPLNLPACFAPAVDAGALDLPLIPPSPLAATATTPSACISPTAPASTMTTAQPAHGDG